MCMPGPSCANVVARTMGVITAPETGSGDWPAWMQSVSNEAGKVFTMLTIYIVGPRRIEAAARGGRIPNVASVEVTRPPSTAIASGR